MLSRKSKYILYIAIFGLFTNCNKEKEEINVYYNTTKGDGLLWNLNDGIYTYSIGFTGNSKIKENKISEYNIVVDSLAAGDLVNKEKKTYYIKNNLKSYDLIKQKNQVKLNDLVVSAVYHYYCVRKDCFKVPYELEIDNHNNVKINIEVTQFQTYTQTEYGGSYEFKLEQKDIDLYNTIQNKLSKNIFVTDTTKNGINGHIIVLNKKFINNNYDTIYDDMQYSSLLMFTDYIILKYIPNKKPSKAIHNIVSFRKPLFPESIVE